jgi:hypothetical protein
MCVCVCVCGSLFWEAMLSLLVEVQCLFLSLSLYLCHPPLHFSPVPGSLTIAEAASYLCL